MAKARKEGKLKRNKCNLIKKIRILKRNQELIKQYS